MDWNGLKQNSQKIKEAPKQGKILAYTRQNVIFESYDSWEEAARVLEEKELLELHMFNDEKEYRAVASRSKRFEHRFVDTVACFDTDSYCDTELLEEKWKEKKISVLNHVKYDETGMLTVDNYRLKMGGEA